MNNKPKKNIRNKKTPLKSMSRARKKKVTKSANSVPILTKYEKNPIISANSENAWEAWQTFNPGVILLDDNVHFMYRAIGLDGQKIYFARFEKGESYVININKKRG